MFIKNKIKDLLTRCCLTAIERSGEKELLSRQLRYERENYWANIFNSTITESDFLNYKSFSPGRWAASYSFLYVLYRVLAEFRPKNIIEFGLGQTSKITIQYAQKYGIDLSIIEHDDVWVKSFIKNFPSTYDVNKYINYLDLKISEVNNEEHYEYDRFNDYLHEKNLKYDMIIIDGPFGSDHQSRNQILNIVDADLLSQQFVIIMDDYERVGEQETISLLKNKLKEKNIQFAEGVYSGEKDQSVIVSSDLKFFTTM